MRVILLLPIMKAPRIHQRVAINLPQVVVAILPLAFAQQSAVAATLKFMLPVLSVSPFRYAHIGGL